jgi:hypothetical protein
LTIESRNNKRRPTKKTPNASKPHPNKMSFLKNLLGGSAPAPDTGVGRTTVSPKKSPSKSPKKVGGDKQLGDCNASLKYARQLLVDDENNFARHRSLQGYLLALIERDRKLFYGTAFLVILLLITTMVLLVLSLVSKKPVNCSTTKK